MKPKSKTRTRRINVKSTPGENDFPSLDAWARILTLAHGRTLTVAQRREERLARGVGRPAKPASAKAKRLMISMTPDLIKAAGVYAKQTGRTLSGLIAESLAEKIKAQGVLTRTLRAIA